MEENIIGEAKENLTEKIYLALLHKLQNNEMVPGTLIDRKALAAEYNVSMAPVRDALQRLSLEGFVETRSRSATVVRAIQKEDIYDIMTLREALESQAIRMVWGDKLLSARGFLLSYAQVVDSCNSIMAYWQADIAFHRQLVLLCNSKLLISTYEQIMSMGNFYQVNKYFVRMDTLQCNSHIQLLERLIYGSRDEAEIALRNHLTEGKTLMFD